MSEVVATAQQGLAGKYKPYPQYKDSGVEWLGVIPTHWSLHALKRTVSGCSNGIWGDEPKGEDDLIVLRVADFDRNKLTVSDDKLTYRSISKKERKTRLLKKGDLLIEKSGGGEKTLVGCVVIFDKDYSAVTSNFVAKMSPRKTYCSNFLRYAFSHLYAGRVNYPSIKQTTGIQNLDSDSYLMEHFCFPDSSDQQTIAAFLDYETARIDRLIAQQQRLIELLKEKRQAVISHAVRTRASEGHIKLAYAINLLTGYPFASSGFKSTKDTHIPLLRGANVGVDQIKWDDVVYWDSEDCSHLDDYYLERGDIVFGMDRPWISSGARVAEITQHDTPCLLLQRVARIRAKANHFQSYIKLCLSSNEFRNYVEADLTGVSVPHISPDQIKGFLIRNLPYDEQVSVTNEVLQVLEKLNAVERAAFNAIELLQERRTALISAAVTGKIDLRGWTPPAEEVAA